MPCCTATFTPNHATSPTSLPRDLVQTEVAVSKQALNTIFGFYGSINQNPVLIGTHWESESLLFLGLEELKFSSGKFLALATFRKLGQTKPDAPKLNWLSLLMALWEQA